jgi:hypothetical protein
MTGLHTTARNLAIQSGSIRKHAVRIRTLLLKEHAGGLLILSDQFSSLLSTHVHRSAGRAEHNLNLQRRDQAQDNYRLKCRPSPVDQVGARLGPVFHYQTEPLEPNKMRRRQRQHRVRTLHRFHEVGKPGANGGHGSKSLIPCNDD